MATVTDSVSIMASSLNQNNVAADAHLASLFREHGWAVDAEPAEKDFRPDLVISKGSLHYVVEIKSAGEGRPDRVLPLLSQAILEARRYAELGVMSPLAVVQVNHASSSLLRKVEQFQRDYARDVAVGLVSEVGASQFIGSPDLESMNVEAPHHPGKDKSVRKASDLFSDLNQWMLKVLLAPELPEGLLNAPRGEYRSASDLADAAQVSAMSASRFVRRLKEDGFLEDAGRSFQLVRRRELFHRWQSAAVRSSSELRMSYLIPGGGARQLHKVVKRLDGCIGLFSAADLLHIGHVSGVVPYVYVRQISAAFGDWSDLVPARDGEPAQIILKQSNAPQSLFRGAVRVDDVLVSDVLQIWLDVSANPSRGAEQADLLKHKVLSNVLGYSE
ncbi:RpiR family transcriptional regulator [Luteibacter yeojuensis]|uniref:RpiR family transcriptional regulator n=2 Tax=Luteibacter yeojuensis TaxID=345309 RepID=A0A7X5QU52_9GAMM|nr:RpiR family transcriptional regulator [Luteibacter yeojuensis]